MASTPAAPSKVSFTIRRPTPISRAASTGADSDSSSFKIPALPAHLAADDSSTPGSPLRPGVNDAPSHKRSYGDAADSSDEEDDQIQDELVTGFDQFGVQRLHEKKKPQGPLVIPALQNRDWRELARARRANSSKQHFVPESARARVGADGSVGGLGTRDSINSGPQMQGLQVRKRVKLESSEMDIDGVPPPPSTEDVKKEEPETEDQRAIRALLAGDDGRGPDVESIPLVSEEDAFQQDVRDLPREATLEDYQRVPIEQFGAALLRGMGWKEGQAASRKGRGPVEPWTPVARPALLGIGAKEKEVFDDGSKGKRGKQFRPERKYVPLVKKEVSGREEEDGRSGSGSRSRSRRGSRSPEPAKHGGRDKHYDSRDKDGDRYRDKERANEQGRDRDGRDKRDYNRDRDRDRDGKRDRDDKRDRERRREKDRDRSPRRNGTKERSRKDY